MQVLTNSYPHNAPLCWLFSGLVKLFPIRFKSYSHNNCFRKHFAQTSKAYETIVLWRDSEKPYCIYPHQVCRPLRRASASARASRSASKLAARRRSYSARWSFSSRCFSHQLHAHSRISVALPAGTQTVVSTSPTARRSARRSAMRSALFRQCRSVIIGDAHFGCGNPTQPRARSALVLVYIAHCVRRLASMARSFYKILNRKRCDWVVRWVTRSVSIY